MSKFDIMLDLLAATQQQLRAVDRQITAVLKLASSPADDTPAIAAPCRHPANARVPMAVMGHPHRFMCRQCGETVEGINGESVTEKEVR